MVATQQDLWKMLKELDSEKEIAVDIEGIDNRVCPIAHPLTILVRFP